MVLALDPARLDLDGTGSGERLDQLAAQVSAAGGRLRGAQRALPEELDEHAQLGVSDQTWADVRQWAQRLRVPAPD
jgi:hypothetical protein